MIVTQNYAIFMIAFNTFLMFKRELFEKLLIINT